MAQAYPAGAGPRMPRRRTEVEAPAQPSIPAARRRALPAAARTASGPPRAARGGRTPGEIDDRVIYRRPDAVPLRPGGARPVMPELVDGVPVYRIYRSTRNRPAYSGSGSD